MKKLSILILVLGTCFAPLFPVYAQDQPAQQPAAEDVEKEKAERTKNAYRLLDQLIDEAQSLRLTENRVRVQTTAADLLWDSNQERARSLFAVAAEGVAELNRAQASNNNRRGPQNVERRSFQLRQELVLAAARHDAQLAYQLLAATKPAPQPAPPSLDSRVPQRQISVEDNLEQMLLGRIAALDPKLAALNAEQMMDKGQFPRTLPEVLNHLYMQDFDAAAKLADKTAKKLATTNLLTNNEAASLAQAFLVRGPRSSEKPAVIKVTGSAMLPLVEQSAYTELLGSVIDLVLKTVVPTPNQRNQPQRGARPAIVSGVGQGQINAQTRSNVTQEQNAARRLLPGLQAALPLIDQYLPAKSAAVRQKLSEAGLWTNSPLGAGQTLNAFQGNLTADAMMQAAAVAPPQMQPRLYQQAAYRALQEGDTERARQIATQHLSEKARDLLIQQIGFREMAQKSESIGLEKVRQTIAQLQTDEEKLNALLQIARDTEKVNPKLASQILDDARQMTNRRATNYQHFDQQLRVARAFLTLDPARSFEVLDPGISQLNELLSAAAVLNGFELNIFRDGEMSLQAGGGLTAMVQRFGQELGQLADKDLERAETLAGRFQFAEPRIMARLAIVQGLLGVNVNRPLNFAGPVIRN